MIPFDYFRVGLTGLANAHRAGTMAGHLGAAVLAGFFLGEDHPNFPAEVFTGLQRELDRIVAGEEGIWFDPQRAGISAQQLFSLSLVTASDPEPIDGIAAALSDNIDALHESGHNVIFASIGLRALHRHAEFAADDVVSGIRRLIAAFHGTYGGRGYFGKSVGWRNAEDVDLGGALSKHRFSEISSMVDTTLKVHVETAHLRKQGFGGLWHVINHAAAIVELNRLGYTELAQRALASQHRHLLLWDALPDVESELGPVIPAMHDPREPAYWDETLKRDDARLTHRVKTLFGFLTLVEQSGDTALVERATHALRYLMG